MLIKLGDQYIKCKDVSFISEPDRHINHAYQGSANTTHYFTIVAGGQKVEIKGRTKKEVLELRDMLLLSIEVDDKGL